MLIKEAPEPGKSCDCCEKEFTSKPCLDHDHDTLKFRGWLCHECNLGIGKLGDNVEGVTKALNYLSNDLLKKQKRNQVCQEDYPPRSESSESSTTQQENEQGSR